MLLRLSLGEQARRRVVGWASVLEPQLALPSEAPPRERARAIAQPLRGGEELWARRAHPHQALRRRRHTKGRVQRRTQRCERRLWAPSEGYAHEPWQSVVVAVVVVVVVVVGIGATELLIIRRATR